MDGIADAFRSRSVSGNYIAAENAVVRTTIAKSHCRVSRHVAAATTTAGSPCHGNADRHGRNTTNVPRRSVAAQKRAGN